jgi:hypothetical protein
MNFVRGRSVALIMVLGATSLGLLAAPAVAATPQQRFLFFDNANDTFTFDIATTGLGNLTVDTRDANTAGDKWGVRLTVRGRTASACGNGSNTQFSGAVTKQIIKSHEKAVATVFACHPAEEFPTCMTVRFQFTGASFTVTQRHLVTNDLAIVCVILVDNLLPL